jgi:methionyl-tRNA formyltransferase
VRLVFAGTPEVALPALDAVADSRHELVGVVTRPDAPSGRGRRMTPSPVAERADELGVPVLKPDHPRDPEFQAALRALSPDCCPVVAYGALLPQSALDIPPHGWVNLHFSCLPAWRGAAPVQHALLAGDEVTGATTFRIVKEMDAGPTFGVMTERIRPTDTAGDLLARLAEGGAGLLVTTLDGIEDGRLEARPQPEDGTSYAPKISVEDAHVDWRHPAVAVDQRIRACTPAPGAWTTYDGLRVKLGPVTVVDTTEETLSPGQLRAGKAEVLVGTATAAVRLGEVKAFGSRQMPAADWARGLRLPPGARFDAGSSAGEAAAEAE